MNVVLSATTQQLLEAQMRDGGYASADELIRVALQGLKSECVEDLAPDVREAIKRAEQEADRGEGMSAQDAFNSLRRKHAGT